MLFISCLIGGKNDVNYVYPRENEMVWDLADTFIFSILHASRAERIFLFNEQKDKTW